MINLWHPVHWENPALAFQLFYLFNHRRRHLARHFDGLDRHRVEFDRPFYDRDFMAAILLVNLDLQQRPRQANWACQFPVRDTGYLLDTACLYHRLWRRASGQAGVAPPAASRRPDTAQATVSAIRTIRQL